MEVYAPPTGTFVLASMEENKVCIVVYTFKSKVTMGSQQSLISIHKHEANSTIYQCSLFMGSGLGRFHNPNPHFIQR